MISNNNQPAVKRLSKRAMKANRNRNIFALLAIILTTFMISSVFSIGISFAKNMTVMNTRLAGTSATIFLNNPSEEQLSAVRKIEGVKSAGTQINIGSVSGKTAESKAVSIAMLCYDITEWLEHIKPAVGEITGTYAQKTDEIMLSQRALTQLGFTKPEIGMKIPLTYEVNGITKSATFTLSGWFTEYESTQTQGIALLFEAFCADNAITYENNGRLCISTENSRPGEVFERLEKEIATKGSQEFSSGYDFSETNSKDLLAVAATITMLALFIVFSGYLLIYNIMYISVTKDIHFFGLLKTIGTSSVQIKKIIYRQALLLSLSGIPAGLILGALTSFVIVPQAMTMFATGALNSAMPGDISFNPLIFIGTALFSLLTVIVSCRKPAKAASRVSPVEAVKYTGIAGIIKKKHKKSTSGGKIYKMAYHNVFREKKRALLVFASLFMGTVTFLSVNSFFSSLDVNNFIDRYYPDDFVYQSKPPLSEQKFDTEFMTSLNKINGIKSKEIVYMEYCSIPFDEKVFEPVVRSEFNTYLSSTETYEDLVHSLKIQSSKNQFGTYVFAISDKYIEDYNKTHDNKIDVDAFRRGEVCIAGYGPYSNMINKTLTLTGETHKKVKDVKIGGVFENSKDCPFAQYTHVVGALNGLFVSERFINELNSSPLISNIILNVEKDKEPAVKAQLNKLNATLTNPTFTFVSRSETAEKFTSTMMTMNVLTSGISVMLILIGIINFINVMLTGIYSRRRELAVLESVGMTKRQIYKMLTFEGGFYALITTVLVMSIGNAIMFLVGKVMPTIADYAVFRYPYLIVTVLIAAIFMICLFVPPVVYKVTAKESVTERLHAADN